MLWRTKGIDCLTIVDGDGDMFVRKRSALDKQLQALPDEMIQGYTYEGEPEQERASATGMMPLSEHVHLCRPVRRFMPLPAYSSRV